MSLYFESTFKSYEDVQYRVRLYVDSYLGIKANIIGGAGTTFYVADDWTDYLEPSQPIYLDVIGNVDTVSSFAYNEAQNRTEITLATKTYTTQDVIANNWTDPATFEPVFSPKIIDIKTVWEDSDGTILAPIMASYSDVVYSNVEEGGTGTKTAFFDRFVDNFLNTGDNEVRLSIERYDGATYKLQWVGDVVKDLLEWSNTSSPRDYTFRAIDGINKLKDVEYDQNIDNPQDKKIIDIVRDVLGYLNSVAFWGSSDPYIRESIEYQSPDMTVSSAANSPLSFTYMSERLLYKKQEKGKDIEYFTGYEILKGIMELFSAKLFHADGMYNIVQIRNYDTAAYSYREFKKSGSAYTASAFNHVLSGARVLSGGKFGYMYGIKEARILQESATVHNQAQGELIGTLKVANNVAFFTLLGNTQILLAKWNKSFGKVAASLSDGKRVTIALRYAGLLNWVGRKFKIKVEIFDLNGNVYYRGGIRGSNWVDPYWGNDLVTPTAERVFEDEIEVLDTAAHIYQIATPTLPFDVDNLGINIEFYAVSPVPGQTNDIAFFHELQVYIPSADEAEFEIIKVQNPNTNFTKDLEMGELLISEGNGLVTANSLSVDVNYPGLSPDINPVRFFDGSFDVEGTLSTLRVLEAMSLQIRNLEKYSGGFVDSDYLPLRTLSYNDKIYVPKMVEKRYHEDEFSGEWYEMYAGRNGYGYNGVYGFGDTTNGNTIGGDYRAPISNAIGAQRQVGSIHPISAGTITSIDLDLTTDVKKGDTLSIVNSNNITILDIVADEDKAAGSGVTLAIESVTADDDISGNNRVINSFRKLDTSDVYRFGTLQHNGTATVPTTVPEMKDNEIRVVGGDLYVRSGGVVYAITGTTYLSL